MAVVASWHEVYLSSAAVALRFWMVAEISYGKYGRVTRTEEKKGGCRAIKANAQMRLRFRTRRKRGG